MERSMRRGYRSATQKREVTELLTYMQRVTGYPRHIIGLQAQRLGLSFKVQKPWGAQEIEILREFAGTMTTRNIARRLAQWSQSSVKNKLHQLHISSMLTDSYSVRQLCELFGVSKPTVNGWLRKGWMSQSLPNGSRNLQWLCS